MLRKPACTLIIFVALVATAVAQNRRNAARTWTDRTGKFKVEATFDRLEAGTVVLKKTDGKIIRVPINRLSRDDQNHAQTLQQKSGSKDKTGKANTSQANLNISATVSTEEPFGVFVFSDLERKKPIFATLKFQGDSITNGTRYGKFEFTSIKDDQGKTLKLLKPVEGKFRKDLGKELADLDHFFLDQPDTLQLHLILEKPTPGAKTISIDGSFLLEVRQAITVDNILEKLNKPLTDPALTKIGRFTAMRPRKNESHLAGSLAFDFVGDRTKIDDIEILDERGIKISTGGTGSGSRQKARIVRWVGEKLPKGAKMRVVMKAKPSTLKIPIKLKSVALENTKPAIKRDSSKKMAGPGSGTGKKKTETKLDNSNRSWTHLDFSKLANRKLSTEYGKKGSGNNLSALKPGTQNLGGIDFQIKDGLLQIGGRKMPQAPRRIDGIPVGSTAKQIHFLHGTQWGRNGGTRDRMQIGEYVVRYEDGTTKSIPIVYGVDVRDWWWGRNYQAPKATRGKIAWVGKNQAIFRLRLYSLSWTNPSPDKKIQRIDFVSKNSPAAPFCVAITLENKK